MYVLVNPRLAVRLGGHHPIEEELKDTVAHPKEKQTCELAKKGREAERFIRMT